MSTNVFWPATGARPWDVVDMTSEASFPASDPPSWTAVTGVGLRHGDGPRRPPVEESPGAEAVIAQTPRRRRMRRGPRAETTGITGRER